MSNGIECTRLAIRAVVCAGSVGLPLPRPPQLWQARPRQAPCRSAGARFRARIDSRPVPRIYIVSAAMTTATGQPPELHRPLPAELLVTDAAHRLAKIAAARAPALGATDAWGMTYLFVNSASCTSLLDRSQQRPAYGTRSSSRRRRDIFASAGNDDRGNDGQRLDHGHLEPAMAADALVFPSLNTTDDRTQRSTSNRRAF